MSGERYIIFVQAGCYALLTRNTRGVHTTSDPAKAWQCSYETATLTAERLRFNGCPGAHALPAPKPQKVSPP